MNLSELRAFALSLPATTEEPHFNFGSFRVGGKILATTPPDGEHVHLFLDADRARELAAANDPGVSELWWGKQLAGVRVRIHDVDAEALQGWVREAWRRRAPKRLAAL